MKPSHHPNLKIIAMPCDANADGDVFGGWLLGQMDLAGAVAARDIARGRVVTVAVEKMAFHRPVFIGDLLECFTECLKIGRTSITIRVEAWVTHRDDIDHPEKVTEGEWVFVRVNNRRQPVPIQREAS